MLLGGTAGQRELVYRQRFFNLSILALKARQLSPLFFTVFFTVFISFYSVFLLFLMFLVFHISLILILFFFARPPNRQ